MEVTDTAKSAFDLSSYPRRDLDFGWNLKKEKRKQKQRKHDPSKLNK